MNRLLTTTFLLVFPASAFAQGTAYEVKGVPLGSTIAEVNAALENPECTTGTGEHGPEEQWCINRTSAPLGAMWTDTFAGQPAQIIYNVVGERVGEITVGGLRADNYSEVLDALTAKYGTPTITHPQVQTKGGSSFENTVATWTRGKDVIVYDRYGRTMQYSWLRFTAGTYAEARKKWQASRATQAVSDM